MSGTEQTAAGIAEPAAVLPLPLLTEQARRLIEWYRYTTDGAGAPVERSAAAILVQLRGHRDRSTTLGQVHGYLDILRAADTGQPPPGGPPP